MRHSPRGLVAIGVVLALLAGCGGDGGSSGGGMGAIPVIGGGGSGSGPSDALLVQQSADTGKAVDQATQVANDLILVTITGTSTSSTPGGSSVFQSPAVSFSFSSQFDLSIDLDAQNAAGEDRFPNATGVIEVSASGTIEGTLGSGEATYAVLITAGTDLVFTNAETGATATIPEGSFWSWMLTIDWSRTDSMNWSVVATAEVAVEVTGLSLDDGSNVVTIDVAGSRTVVCTLERVDGELSHSRTIEGSLAITIDDGSAVNEVVIEILDFNQYMVTINGEEFGPLTREEVRALFDAQFE